MANIGGKISLDISELQKNIAIANRLIKEHEANWAQSALTFDDWTKSEEGVEARLQVSNKIIEQQEKILETLNEKKKRLIEAYGAESNQVAKVNAEITKYAKALTKSKTENGELKSTLEKLENGEEALKKDITDTTKAVKSNTSALEKNADESKDARVQVVNLSEGFTVFKGVLTSLASSLIKGVFSNVKNIINTINTLPETTRELRRELIQVSTAFRDIGFSSKTAENAFIEYAAVLGTVDSNASSTISLLASLSSSTVDLANWTTVLSGVYAKLGKSYPTAELVKNIKETVNSGKMTENLKKVLQSAGVDTDEFTEKIEKLNNENERTQLILSTLISKYSDLGEFYKQNNKDIIEAEKANLRLRTAWAELGALMEPIKTNVTNAVSDVVSSFSSLLQGATDIDTFLYNVGYLAGTVTREFKKVYDLLEPVLKDLKDKILGWFNNNLDDMKKAVAEWLKSIFGEDTFSNINKIIDIVVEPIKKFIKQIESGDYLGALGTAMPVITIGVGLSLLQGTISAIPNLILSGLTSGFKGAGITLSTVASGLIGAITLGLAIKDVLSGDMTYEAFGGKVVAGILAGLLASGLGATLAGGILVATMAFQLLPDWVGESAVKSIKNPYNYGKSVGEAVIEGWMDAKAFQQINEDLAKLSDVAKATAEEIKLVITGASTDIPVTFTWAGTTEVKKKLNTEISKMLNDTFVATGKISMKESLKNIFNNASEGGKELAQAIADGYEIGIEDIEKITELEAMQIILTMKEVLGIHSPSKEAEAIGVNFVQGWEDGLAGLPNVTRQAMEESVEEANTVASEGGEEVGNTFGKKLGETAGQIGDAICNGLTFVLENYDADTGAQGIYDSIYSSLTEKMKEEGGWWGLVGVMLNQVRKAMKSDDAEKYIQQMVTDIIDGIIQLITDLPEIVRLALEIIIALIEGFAKAIPELISNLDEIIIEIVQVFIDAAPRMVEAGIELIKGLGKGIWEGVKSIGNLIYEAGCAVVDWFCDVFGIASPSKVMRDEIGRNIMLGMVEGINEGIPLVEDAIGAVDTSLNFGTVASAGTRGVNNGRMVTVNQYNNYSRSYSAYELYKSERNIKRLVGAY